MNMNMNGMAELLAEILDTQIETGEYGEIDEERFRESLINGPPLSKKEQSLLLLSPIARNDYSRIRNKVNREIAAHLAEQGVEVKLNLPLAAATKEEKVTMNCNGFTLVLYRQDDFEIPWLILIQLEEKFLKVLNKMTVLRLVDSGGLEWLRGKPNAEGEIAGTWEVPETDLFERSNRFSLSLLPV